MQQRFYVKWRFRNNSNNQLNIIKVIKFLENRGISFKGTTRKITSQEGKFLNFLRPLMTNGLPLMKIVLTSLAKNVLMPLGLTTAISATDAVIKKNNVSGTAALIISNEEMEDIIKIVRSLE